MTIAAYQTLYESSIAYGIRKALLAEYKRTELQNQIRGLESEKGDLQMAAEELELRCESIVSKANERRSEEERIHQEEVERTKKTNESLRQQLEQILSNPKK